MHSFLFHHFGSIPVNEFGRPCSSILCIKTWKLSGTKPCAYVDGQCKKSTFEEAINKSVYAMIRYTVSLLCREFMLRAIKNDFFRGDRIIAITTLKNGGNSNTKTILDTCNNKMFH